MDVEETEISELSIAEQHQRMSDGSVGLMANTRFQTPVKKELVKDKKLAAGAKAASPTPTKQPAPLSGIREIQIVESSVIQPQPADIVSKQSNKTEVPGQQSPARNPYLTPVPRRVPQVQGPPKVAKTVAVAELSPEQEFGKQVIELAQKAKAGDKAAVKELSNTFEEHPYILQFAGDLGRLAERMLIDLVSRGNALTFESMIKSAANMREELMGANPNPLVRLAVQRVVACWLFAQFADTNLLAADKPTAAAARLQEVAEKRWLTALKALNLARRMSAPEIPSRASLSPVPNDIEQPVGVAMQL